MENLSWYVYATFGVTVLLTCWLFIKASGYSRTFIVILAVWILLQSIAAIFGFYSEQVTMTTRFPLLVLPPLLFIISGFVTKKGKLFIDHLNIKTLTILHIIRLPVELVLFWLFAQKAIPQAMTFEGRNFDILSGLTAPLIWYGAFVKKWIGRTGLIIWNVACLLLLLNVVANALLSLPSRFAQFGFEQPNIGLGYFPFILLPACLVPIVLFSNLAALRLLVNKRITI
jgi:hypothetical protein